MARGGAAGSAWRGAPAAGPRTQIARRSSAHLDPRPPHLIRQGPRSRRCCRRRRCRRSRCHPPRRCRWAAPPALTCFVADLPRHPAPVRGRPPPLHCASCPFPIWNCRNGSRGTTSCVCPGGYLDYSTARQSGNIQVLCAGRDSQQRGRVTAMARARQPPWSKRAEWPLATSAPPCAACDECYDYISWPLSPAWAPDVPPTGVGMHSAAGFGASCCAPASALAPAPGCCPWREGDAAQGLGKAAMWQA